MTDTMAGFRFELGAGGVYRIYRRPKGEDASKEVLIGKVPATDDFIALVYTKLNLSETNMWDQPENWWDVGG